MSCTVGRRYLVFLLVFVSIYNDIKCSSEPLLITPYLTAGMIKEAREMALVTPDMDGVKSYTGFFTVNKECGSNLFFWFIPAQNNWETAPVLLWLSGGPGASSLIGMFTEVGPFNHLKKKGFVRNDHHWAKDNNVIFLDQPVGTGFSFTDNKCYAENMTLVAKDAHTALIQFFTLFPNLHKSKFFITGESFAGHFIPAIAYEIHKRNENASEKINLKGIVMGDPYIDTRCHLESNYLYELGIVDEKTRDILAQVEKNITIQINKKNYTGAVEAAKNGPDIDVGLPSIYNILYEKNDDFDFEIFVRNYKIRSQIHVGDLKYSLFSDTVYDYLHTAMSIPAISYLEDLLASDKYIVGLYTGQLDVVCQYTSVPCVLNQVKWSGANDYRTANRSQWFVNGRLAGWFKVAGNLFEVVLRNSGHFVPTDQPRAALELITAAVSSTPGSKVLAKLESNLSLR